MSTQSSSVQLLLLLLFAFLLQNQSCNSATVTTSSLYSRLAGIHRAHKAIHRLLATGSTLANLEPTLRSFNASQAGNLLGRCYNASIGGSSSGSSVSMFSLPLATVLRRFVSLHYRLFVLKDHQEVKKRVGNLLNNVRLVARSVVKCVLKSQKDKLFKPTTLGLSMFSAFSWKEIKSRFTKPLIKFPPLGSSAGKGQKLLNTGFTGPCISGSALHSSLRARLPAAFDWRSKAGVLTGVKEQLDCGSCYAFSAIASLESAYAIQVLNRGRNLSQEEGESSAKPVQPFSEQDIVNCYSNDGNDGCGLGYPHEVLNLTVYRGVMLQKDRPYTSKVEKCTPPQPLFARPRSWCLNRDVSDETFKAVVYFFGPAIVGFNTDDPAFFHLKGGHYNRKCSPGATADHAMLLVGWTEAGEWIIKNSYGRQFGLDGYLVVPADIARGCGMAVFTGAPVFEKTALHQEVERLQSLGLQQVKQSLSSKLGLIERLFG